MQKKVFILTKKTIGNENLKAHVARLSRMATSLALKCSGSKTLLDDLERAFQKLELEVDESLSKIQDTDVLVVSNDSAGIDRVNSAISFRVPQIVKGAKTKRARNVVEKKTKKKNKSSQERGNTCENMSAPNNSSNMLVNFSSTVPCFMPGEYTSLLLGLDQEASTA
jgi:hypothetical protein